MIPFDVIWFESTYHPFMSFFLKSCASCGFARVMQISLIVTVLVGTTTQRHAFPLKLAWLTVLAAKDFSNTFTQLKRFESSPTPFGLNLRSAQ